MFNRKLATAVVVLCGALSTAPAQAGEAPNLDLMRQFISVMQGYYEVIDSTHAIASDPEKSAILQLHQLYSEVLQSTSMHPLSFVVGW